MVSLQEETDDQDGNPQRQLATEDYDQQYEGEQPPEITVVALSPKVSEQLWLFSSALEMRNEASFCDISFIVNGNIFRAHRVIVRYIVVIVLQISYHMHISNPYNLNCVAHGVVGCERCFPKDRTTS